MVAVTAVALVGTFILLNLGHQAKLRLFREFQVNTLLLLLIGFLSGAALVLLRDLWKRCKRTERSRGSKTGNAFSDKDL